MAIASAAGTVYKEKQDDTAVAHDRDTADAGLRCGHRVAKF
jgi:hypothetical protein